MEQGQDPKLAFEVASARLATAEKFGGGLGFAAFLVGFALEWHFLASLGLGLAVYGLSVFQFRMDHTEKLRLFRSSQQRPEKE